MRHLRGTFSILSHMMQLQSTFVEIGLIVNLVKSDEEKNCWEREDQ